MFTQIVRAQPAVGHSELILVWSATGGHTVTWLWHSDVILLFSENKKTTKPTIYVYYVCMYLYVYVYVYETKKDESKPKSIHSTEE